MITETARVVRVTENAIWVKANPKSACGSCAEKKGCGQSLLAEWAEKNTVLRIDDLAGFNILSIKPDDQVVIGVPETMVVEGSLILYFVPLLALVLGAVLGHQLFASDSGTAVVAILGLLTGGYIAARYSQYRYRNNIQPVLMEHVFVEHNPTV